MEVERQLTVPGEYSTNTAPITAVVSVHEADFRLGRWQCITCERPRGKTCTHLHDQWSQGFMCNAAALLLLVGGWNTG